MKKLIPSFIIIAALALAVTGCKKDKKDGKGSAAAKKVTLTQVSDATFGYEIQIPKDSKTLQKGEYGHTYSYPLPDGMFEYNIHITKIAANSLKDLVRNATMMGQKKIAEKKAIPGGFLVLKAPQGALQEVWVSKNGKTAKLTVKCSGPAKAKDLMVKICSSLKVTK